MDKSMRKYADEAIEIIKDVIINNELVNGDLVSYVGCNEDGDTIFIRDLLGCEIEYSLSEISYVFVDSIDCIGHMNKSAYKTVINSSECENYEENKNAFMKAFLRLKEIEKYL